MRKTPTIVTNLCNNIDLLDREMIVKVTTIKKKFVDQIPELNLTHDDSFLEMGLTAIGYVSPYLIFIPHQANALIDGDEIKIDHLVKLRKIDFVQFYAEEKAGIGHLTKEEDAKEKIKTYKKYLSEAKTIIKDIPMLFQA